MHSRVRRIGELGLSLLQNVIPKTDIVAVHGTPTTEGNAVEVISALSRRYQGRIIWIVDDDPHQWKVDRAISPVDFVGKWTLRGLYLYLRSEVLFYTHGIYGAVTPGKNQTFVNLWHGDGIKRKPTADASKHSLWPATYVSGGTLLLTKRKVHDFKMNIGSELVFGNPRVVQFYDPVSSAFLDEIGIGSQPFLVWMPTFRKSSATGAGYEAEALSQSVSTVVDYAARRNMRVVVKAHRQDAESRNVVGTISVDDDQLVARGVTLYSLLGASAGLITDYSSVWTDYLLLDRPIGFLIPDAGRYVASRGLYPDDILRWLPGCRLDSPSDIESFVDSVISPDSDSFAVARSAASERLGLARSDCPADRLLDELSSRGCFRRGKVKAAEIHFDSRPRLAHIDEH